MTTVPRGPLLPPARPRPAGRGRGAELWSWVFVRVSGCLLLVLVVAHLVANLVVGDGMRAVSFALVAERWSNPFRQLWSLSMLWLAVLHGANGMRIVVLDHARRAAVRRLLLLALAVAAGAGAGAGAGATVALGPLVLLTFEPCPAGADPASLPGFCHAG
ncbi:succinate dehydrogenase/fumarate reductase transmembrane subunit [Kineococcus sp. SYSU DK004]|uniref:hypothetical protein n=1 Tax=Kineococcus sp. SYSU DK004 TaxID=3383125 RepID=UPI003D7EFBAD